MGTSVYSLVWVMLGLYHQPYQLLRPWDSYKKLGFTGLCSRGLRLGGLSGLCALGFKV